MVFHYLASVPACATVVLLHCSHVLFCACVFPFLYLSCLSAWRLQTPLVLTGLIWFRSSHSRALSSYGPLASCSFFVLPQCLTVLLVPLIVSMCLFFFFNWTFFLPSPLLSVALQSIEKSQGCSTGHVSIPCSHRELCCSHRGPDLQE